MKKQNNLFLGGLLVAFGSLFLAYNYNLFDFDYSFRQIARFWPVLLILAGVAVLLNERRSIYNPVTALMVAFAIPLGIYSFASSGVDRIKTEFNDELNLNFDDEDWKDDLKEEFGKEHVEQDFSVPLENEVTEAKLKISGGAGEFDLKKSDGNLFEAKTSLDFGSYKMSEERIGNTHDIEFEMKGKKGNFNMGEHNKNEVMLGLSTKPIWDIELGIGAGELDFDLSDFSVKNLDIKTGAADIDVKLGALNSKTDVKVESGVASVSLEIPESVGCEIHMDGALNSKDFDGFDSVGNKTYRTANFDQSSKKIFIDVSSGLSSVAVKRY